MEAIQEQQVRLEPAAVLRSFAGLVKSVGLYPDGHPSIDQTAADLSRILQPMLDNYGTLAVDLIEGEAHVGGRAFRRESKAIRREISALQSLGIDSFIVEPGVQARDLRVLAEQVHAQGPLTGTTHARAARLVPVAGDRRFREWPDKPERAWDSSYAQALEQADETFETFASGGAPDIEALGDLVQVITERVARSSLALSQVLALKEFENHTYCHSVNVSVLSLMIARRIGLDESVSAHIAEAAVLHDIGKTRIPREILNKPGGLDDREWQVIRRHPRLGAEILLRMNGLSPLTATVALEHHMGYTGGGYPEITPDYRPHPMSQLVAVADIYESLTGARTYRDPAPPQQACLILARLAGQQLNPAFVRTFVSAITFFPLGTIVRTSHNEIGLVVRASEQEPLHPTIRLIEDGELAPVETVTDTSLRDDSGQYLRHIEETLRPDSIGLDLDSILGGSSGSAAV